jgi:hypothetical protein
MELVQLFQENCISKEFAYRIRRAETMTEAWARLDTLCNSPMRFILDLMQEVRAFLKLEEQEYERLLDYYSLLLNFIKEASKAGYRNGFLTQAYIEEMTRALPLREKTLWRKREACILPDEHDEAFLTFVNDHQPQIADKAHEVRRILPMPSPLPIDAARSGSGGGSKGKGARKNAYTVPVQRGNKCPRQLLPCKNSWEPSGHRSSTEWWTHEQACTGEKPGHAFQKAQSGTGYRGQVR